MRCNPLGLVVLSGSLWLMPGFGADPTPLTADEQLVQKAKVGTDGASLLSYFRKRTLPEVDAGNIRDLVRQLGDEDFLTRERACSKLVALRTLALPFLEAAAKDTDIEISRRALDCIRRIGGGPSLAVDAAAARLVAARKPAGAVEVMLNFLPYASTDHVADEVLNTLALLAVRDGQTDKALLAAIADKSAPRRAGAALALHRAGAADAKAAVRKLLQDPDPMVRYRIGMALARAKDKDAVPVLIDVLPHLMLAQAWLVEDMLYSLAEERGPDVWLGVDEVGRKKCRDAWSDWWTKHGAKVDMARLEPNQKGLTLLVFLDAGKVMEVDQKGEKLWEVGGIDFPLDAQVLPNDRVLLAEYKGARVTERDRKGTVVWEKKLGAGPLAAQRLANGNTFITTETQLIEVDKTGKEVFTYSRPNGEGIRKAMKLRNGDLACVTTGNQFVRLNPVGRTIMSFPVEVSTNGGRIEVLPSGRVLIPVMSLGKVIEFDSEGRAVWEVAIEEPVAAVRLPNGNTLVTTLNQNRAMEFDRAGKEVWQYKGDTRITRAFRR
ncbi:MAG: PQQ-binding-like beta-propeller repeat protein [Gemmataceae bacterium]|nr:PQQ-binding-like beta-propeller repeat protein [Gemmataceae bacterium]